MGKPVEAVNTAFVVKDILSFIPNTNILPEIVFFVFKRCVTLGVEDNVIGPIVKQHESDVFVLAL